VSLRARLLAAFAYTLLVVIVALEVPLAANLSDRVDAEVEADSAAQAQVVAGSIADELRRPGRLDALTEEAARQLGGRVFVVDGRGRLLADSSDEIQVGSSVFANQEHPPLLEALDGRIGQGTHPPDLDVLSTAVPIIRGGRTVGALEVEQSVDAVNDAIREDVVAVIGIGLLALVLGLGVAWILAGSIARPLRSLGAVARRMASGDLRARASERGSREQADLAHAFNEMAERIESVVASQRAFVADASHQLRTPLTGLRLRLEAAGVKTSDPAVERELAAAEKEAARLDVLVADLLALAASEEPAEDEEADLGAAARAAAERWRVAASDAGAEIAIEGTGEATVRAGPRELDVILDNLIENAIKYSPRGADLRIAWEASDGTASVAVLSPSGPLDPEVAEHAFERFYRGGARAQGTGLGLAIVAALARRRGGRASLENADGGAVRAEVTLPALPSPNPTSVRFRR
jgi:two-component system, OmpR family, sensor kinase